MGGGCRLQEVFLGVVVVVVVDEQAGKMRLIETARTQHDSPREDY
jgi:hypothetical protein